MQPQESSLTRLAVLISGSGRTLNNLIRATTSGELPTQIICVISSRPGVPGLLIASAAGIDHQVLQRHNYTDDAEYSAAIFTALAPSNPQLIVLAGFLRRIIVPPAWDNRILNIHPALLPESEAAGAGFYGDRVHQAVLASGATESGATVHVVNNEYDSGTVIMKQRVPVLATDTVASLAARVFAAEQELYPAAIKFWLREHPKLLAGPA